MSCEIAHRATGQIAGALVATGWDPSVRRCFIRSFNLGGHRHRLAFDGVVIGLDIAFNELSGQRVRFDVLGFNLQQFKGVAHFAEAEGIRRDWVFWNGRFWDAHLFTISRTAWEVSGGAMVRRFRHRDDTTQRRVE